MGSANVFAFPRHRAHAPPDWLQAVPPSPALTAAALAVLKKRKK